MAKLTDEERVAIKMRQMYSDLNLDLDLVGFYFATISPQIVYLRAEEIMDSAKHTKEKNAIRDQD
jgi:hypothetical protein